MRCSVAGIILIVSFLYGCSEQAVNPCELITLEEVRTLAPGARAHEWHPAATSKTKDNELCLWHDGGDNNVFMLFYFQSASVSPYDMVKSGMSGAKARIVKIEGVGDSAAAGFSGTDKNPGGALKMFAASANGRTIGIRVRGINNEADDEFQQLKLLASKALSRI